MWRAFRRSPGALIGTVATFVILLTAVLGPILFTDAANKRNLSQANQGPSGGNWLGTDRLGQDILLRIIAATGTTLKLALFATFLGALVGFTLGAVSSVLSPRLRNVLVRLIDAFVTFPAILVAIFVGVVIGPGETGAWLGVGIALSFSMARVASTLASSIAGQEFVAAARVLGVSRLRQFRKYILPNIAETLFVIVSVSISSAIVFISSLSFLGLGVQPPKNDWGRMLIEGVQSFYTNGAAALGPAAAILICALAFGYLGEALARTMNPRLWTEQPGRRPRADRASISSVDASVGAMLPMLSMAGPGAVDAMADIPTDEPWMPGFKGVAVVDRNNGKGSTDAAVVVRDLVVTFPGANGPVDVVRGVSFSIGKGEKLAIVGESGSGKTMTAMALSQLIPWPGRVTGSVTLAGRELAKLSPNDLNKFLGTELAVVFQDPMGSLNPALKIGTQLREGSQVHRRLSRRAATSEAIARLADVNIPSPRVQLKRHPHEFSGGMLQRTVIAMGLMNKPDLIVADEPTTALDVTIQAQIMELFDRINQEHQMAMILISHNIALVALHCDRVLVMYAGQIVEDLTTLQILSNPLHPYTKALLGVVPDIDTPIDVKLADIPGQAPDPAHIPDGCPFRLRCAFAVERCAEQMPPLIRRPDGRRIACWVANEDLT
jgi:oligopeptide/dipeptide ABC transporter ATP-binding protein